MAAIRCTGYGLIAIDFARTAQSVIAGPVLTAICATESYCAVDLQVSMLAVGLFVVLVRQVMDMGRELHERDRLTM